MSNTRIVRQLNINIHSSKARNGRAKTVSQPNESFLAYPNLLNILAR